MIQQGPLRLLFSFIGPKTPSICEHKWVKNCEESRVLPYVQAGKLVWCYFMDAGTKEETPGPETIDDL